MSGQNLFERILQSLQAGVFDDALWPATSALIDEFCGAKGNSIVFGEGTVQNDFDLFFARFCRRGQRHAEMERLYFEVYHAVDERAPRFRQLPDSQVVHVSSLYTEEEMKSSVVYNEALPLFGTRDSLNVRLDGPDGSRISWAIADPAEGDGWSATQVEALERLLPVGRRTDWTPIGALTSCFLLIHRGQHRALNNTCILNHISNRMEILKIL